MAGMSIGGIYGGPTAASQAYQSNLDINANRDAARKAASMNTIMGGLTNAMNMYGSNNNQTPYGPTGGSTSYSMPAPAPMPAPQANATLTPPDTTAANAATFAKAKDQVGQEGRAALTGLKGAMAGRGILGSGVEGRGIQNVITSGQQQLGDVTRQNAITNADLAQKNAEAAYTGGVAQRGQDVSQNTAAFQGGVTERGQDIQAQEAQNQLAAQQQIENQRIAAQRQQAIMGLLGQISFSGSY